MQLTIRNVPPRTEEALRRRAKDSGKSLNEVAREALEVGLGLTGQPVKRRDLSMFAGTWVEDPEFDKIIAEQDQVHPDEWK